ncbi:peptidoglycan binding protein CsiV [Shewanella sp. A3A]|nr:peptidoglycan binding protein CsiV [Shewanella ferrihydritica]
MIKHLLLATVASLSAMSVQAANYPWYEVEVYLFERPTNVTEQWPSTPLTLKTDNAIDLITPQVANDITGVAMALSDCNQNSWGGNSFDLNSSGDSTSKTPCQNLNGGSKLVLPKQIPVNIVPNAGKPAAQPSAVLLGADKARFNDEISKLRRLGIEPLLHMTWQQEMRPRRAAQPVHLFAGKNYAEQFQANGMPVSMEAKNNQYGYGQLTEQTTSAPVWQFDGLLTIYLSHYLYVETQFNLREPEQKTLQADESTQSATTVIPYLGVIPMEQNRRIRSAELHYFDHPRLGMLLQVRKMQQPVAGPLEDDEAPEEADEPAATNENNQ